MAIINEHKPLNESFEAKHDYLATGTSTYERTKCPKCKEDLKYAPGRQLTWSAREKCAGSDHPSTRIPMCDIWSIKNKYGCLKCGEYYCIKCAMSNSSGKTDIDNSTREEYDRIHTIVDEFVEDIKDAAKDKEGLDVYQAVAIALPNQNWGFQSLSISAALITAVAQILGTLLFIKTCIKHFDPDYNGEYCLRGHDAAETLLAISLTIVAVGYVQFHSYLSIQHHGLYGLCKIYQTKYYSLGDTLINKWMLLFGLWTNQFVMTLTMFGAFTVIYTAADVIDLVLNSTALFFIIEIDDMFVPFWYYKRLACYLQSDAKRFESQNILNIGVKEKDKTSFKTCQSRRGKCELIGPNLLLGLNAIWFGIHHIVFLVTFIGCPIFLAVCYHE